MYTKQHHHVEKCKYVRKGLFLDEETENLRLYCSFIHTYLGLSVTEFDCAYF